MMRSSEMKFLGVISSRQNEVSMAMRQLHFWLDFVLDGAVKMEYNIIWVLVSQRLLRALRDLDLQRFFYQLVSLTCHFDKTESHLRKTHFWHGVRLHQYSTVETERLLISENPKWIYKTEFGNAGDPCRVLLAQWAGWWVNVDLKTSFCTMKWQFDGNMDLQTCSQGNLRSFWGCYNEKWVFTSKKSINHDCNLFFSPKLCFVKLCMQPTPLHACATHHPHRKTGFRDLEIKCSIRKGSLIFESGFWF